AHVVHVVDRPAENLAMRARVKVLERQTIKLLLHLAAKLIDRSLRHTSHNILLNIHENRTDYIQSQQDQQHRRDICEVDARLRKMVEKRLVFRDQTIKKPGCCHAQDFRSHNIEDRADNGRDQHDEQEKLLRHKVPHQPLERPLEVFGLLNWPAHRSPTTSPHWAAAHPPLSARALCTAFFAHAISSAISSIESCEV